MHMHFVLQFVEITVRVNTVKSKGTFACIYQISPSLTFVVSWDKHVEIKIT